MFIDELDAVGLRLWNAGAFDIDLKEGVSLKHHSEHPDAPPSPIKLNLCTPKIRQAGRLTDVDIARVGSLMWQYLRDHDIQFSGIAGVPHAGIPLVDEIVAAAYHEDGQVLCRLWLDKERGLRKVEDYLPSGETVLLVDDVLTRATSKRAPVKILRDTLYRVTDCLVFADRNEGGRAVLADMGIALHAVTDFRRLLTLGVESGKLSPQEKNTIAGRLWPDAPAA